MADLELRLRDLTAPVEVPTGQVNRLIVTPFGGGLLEMEDLNFHFDSAVLLPDQSSDAGTTAEQDRVSGIEVLAVCLEQAELRTDELLLLAGHTDKVGDAGYNVALSQLRAENVLHALLGNRGEWVSISEKKFQVEDYQQILKWAAQTFGFDSDPGKVDGIAGSQTFVALKTFQAQFNERFEKSIAVNGVIGSETWGAFFDLYMQSLADTLDTDQDGLSALRANLHFLDEGKRAVGCGFNHPVDSTRLTPGNGDPSEGSAPAGFRSAKDRRVELLFFSPDDTPKLDCHPGAGKCNPAVCEIYQSHHFQFEYLKVNKIEVVDFFVRPQANDSSDAKPHNVIISAGDAVVVHWSLRNTERIEIHATALDGVRSQVALPNGGNVKNSETPLEGEVTLTPAEDITLTLTAFAGHRRERFPVCVDVHILLPGSTTPPETTSGEDFIDVVTPASPGELLARAASEPENDERLAGPVTKPPPKLIPAPKAQAIAPKSTAPQVLKFTATEQFMAALSAQAMRAKAVKTLREFYGFGVSDLPKGRNAAYGDLIAFDESPSTRASLLQKTVTNSSCALVIRSLWRLLGARDFVREDDSKGKAKSGRIVDEFLIDPPFSSDGLLIGRLLRFATLCKAIHFVRGDAELAAFDPKPGDVIFLTKQVFKPGKNAGDPPVSSSAQHIFTVTKRDGDTIFSIDGGQPAPAKLADGTELKLPVSVPSRPKGAKGESGDRLPDGACNGIWSAKRTLLKPDKMVTVDRSKIGESNVTEQRLGFKGESRPIEAWIELPKLVFTASIIELVKNGGRVKPGLPEEAVPNVDPTTLDAQTR
jgi:hypothetical protein